MTVEIAVMLNRSIQVRRRPKHQREIPHLFGRGGRDRALICLAANGPLTVREIGRAIGSDSHKTWDMVAYLERCGLVVRRSRPGGRKYIALNRKLPIYRRLNNLLLALSQRWPIANIETAGYRWSMWCDKGTITPHRLDHMFYSPVRSRILLYIAAVGVTDVISMYKALGIGSVSALYAVNHWEREGITQSLYYSRQRFVSLDENYCVHKELKYLLEGLVMYSSEYKALRARARSRSVRETR